MAARKAPIASSNGHGAAAFTGTPKAKGYAPKAYGYTLDWNDQRPFFKLVDVERMRRDPQVSLALRILRAPLSKITFNIRASAPEVGQFIEGQLKKIWKRHLTKLCKMFAYGYCPGEWVYSMKETTSGGYQVGVKDLIDFHPFDTAPLQVNAQLVGLQVKGVPGEAMVRIGSPRFCWVVNDPEFNSFYGRSRLLNCWTPWMEKTARHGALDIRRMWFIKNAYNGGTMRHPPGTTETAEGLKDNQDIAREIIEKIETGGIVVLPNFRDDKNDGYAWTMDPPSVNGDIRDVREYPKDLDREILLGAGIPPEVVQASGESGSGYAGRAIPAQVFYASLDEAVSTIIGAVDAQCLRPMVTFNFGPDAWYEIDPESLLEKEKPPPQQPQMPPGRPQIDPQGDDVTMQPYRGPNGGRGQINPNTDEVEYGLSLEAVEREANRQYPLDGWVMLSNGEWARTVERKRNPPRAIEVSLSIPDPPKEVAMALPDETPPQDNRPPAPADPVNVYINVPQAAPTPVYVNIPEQPAPIFNVPQVAPPNVVFNAPDVAPVFNVPQSPAPIVQVPEAPAPQVVVNPTINVPEAPAAQVVVMPATANKRVEEIRDARGQPTGSFRIVTE